MVQLPEKICSAIGGEREVFSAIYPQDWIIDPDGRVAYVNSVYEPDEMQSLLDSMLEDSR